MKYEIIATLGPGSDAESTWDSMVSAGATGFRLNTSHLSLDQLESWIDRIAAFLASRGSSLPLVLDLQGSKWRLGQFSSFDLVEGQKVELVCAAAADRPQVLPVPHADFFKAASLSSGEINLNDAKSRLRMELGGPDWLHAAVVQGGRISAAKGITLPASEYRKEALNEKDQTIHERTQNVNFIRYAVSYVKDAAEMAGYRSFFGQPAYLAAKLEREQAVFEAAEIAGWADELWLCRGDLGAELGMKAMAETVYRFSEDVWKLSVPALMAGQVLEHMAGQASVSFSGELSPTRSEVCYLYDTLVRGYRGFVLSDETAIGRYPVQSCRTAALFLD
jgi:pyruvate kinase